MYIIDEKSWAKSSPDQVLENLRKSSMLNDESLMCLCNWYVYMDFENIGYELRVLSDKNIEWKDEPIVEQPCINDAFIHKLSFYSL